MKVSESLYIPLMRSVSATSIQIDEEVKERIERSPFVTMLADDSADIANKKLMTMRARIIDPKTSVAETIYLGDVER